MAAEDEAIYRKRTCVKEKEDVCERKEDVCERENRTFV